eukprot:6214547-Pleurochrysis_carterae.AAC.2
MPLPAWAHIALHIGVRVQLLLIPSFFVQSAMTSMGWSKASFSLFSSLCAALYGRSSQALLASGEELEFFTRSGLWNHMDFRRVHRSFIYRLRPDGQPDVHRVIANSEDILKTRMLPPVDKARRECSEPYWQIHREREARAVYVPAACWYTQPPERGTRAGQLVGLGLRHELEQRAWTRVCTALHAHAYTRMHKHAHAYTRMRKHAHAYTRMH